MAYSTVVENFLRYVKIDTQSSEETSDKVPSTDKQRTLAKLLQQELTALGAAKVRFIPESVSSSMHIATLHSSAQPNLKKTVNICKS